MIEFLYLFKLSFTRYCYSFTGFISSSICTGFSYGAEGMALTALPDYFDRYFDYSQSIAHSGMAVGIMIMPPLTQFLLFIYGWRGSVLILSGLSAHITVSGALLRPTTQSNCSIECNTTETWDKHDDEDVKNQPSKRNESWIEKLSRLFDLHLFTNFDFVSLLLISFANGYYYVGWLIYLVPHAEDLGFSPYAATTLATVGGIGNFVGSCAFPLVSTKISNKSLIYISNIVVFLSLVVDPILSLKSSYSGLVVASFIMNAAEAMDACAIFKETYNVVDLTSFTFASNFIYVSCSLGVVCSGFLSGRQICKYRLVLTTVKGIFTDFK